MSALTDKLEKLLEEVKTKIHSLLDSSEVKTEETDVKQQVTQVIDDAKTDAGSIAKEAETDVEKDVSAVSGDVSTVVGAGGVPLTEQQQAQVDDPNVDATNPHAVQNPVPAGTPQATPESAAAPVASSTPPVDPEEQA